MSSDWDSTSPRPERSARRSWPARRRPVGRAQQWGQATLVLTQCNGSTTARDKCRTEMLRSRPRSRSPGHARTHSRHDNISVCWCPISPALRFECVGNANRCPRCSQCPLTKNCVMCARSAAWAQRAGADPLTFRDRQCGCVRAAAQVNVGTGSGTVWLMGHGCCTSGAVLDTVAQRIKGGCACSAV